MKGRAMKKIEEEEILKKFPSTELGYEIGLKSYDFSLQRSDAVDNRIDRMLAWISGINLGTIAVFKANEISFNSIYFTIAVALFLTILVIGMIGKARGTLTLIEPKKIFDSWLYYGKLYFKYQLLSYIGEHFEKNQDFVNWKAKLLNWMIFLFLLEIIVLGIWIIFPNHYC